METNLVKSAALGYSRLFLAAALTAGLSLGVVNGTTASAQAFASSAEMPAWSFTTTTDSAGASSVQPGIVTGEPAYRPFSHLAFGGGISPLGVGLQTVTDINRHLNLRFTGNVFSYSPNNISTEGFSVNAKLNLSSAGASVDYYPFHAGFRLSPGILFYNGNKATATFITPAGASFTLDNNTFYSGSGANAVTGLGTFGLGNGTPAFTLTTGWGNQIPAHGGHWSFPVEVGVAFIQAPTVALTLSGQVCDQYGQNCSNVATNQYAQEALAAQIQKYQNDFNPLKTYPIVSFGVAYSFRTRSVHSY
jgi:hypothetical protein